MLHKTIIFCIGIFTLANCRAQKETKASVKNSVLVKENKKMKPINANEEIIYFKEGENRFLKEYQMNVTFTEVAEDSRCPSGSKCKSEGTALVKVQVMGTTTRPMTLSLATEDNSEKNYHTSAQFNGYTISLAELTPYPNLKENTKALTGNYNIGITIKKLGE